MGAAYDSGECDPALRYLPGIRRTVLKQIEIWVEAGSKGRSILWVHGRAGAGKSAIAQTVAETCAGRDELAASFFLASFSLILSLAGILQNIYFQQSPSIV